MADFNPPPLFTPTGAESDFPETISVIITRDPDPDKGTTDSTGLPPPDREPQKLDINAPPDSDPGPADANPAESGQAEAGLGSTLNSTGTAQVVGSDEKHSEDNDNRDDTPPASQAATSDDKGAATKNPSPSDPNDLMYSVDGMYRILDLISETGSGGLVEKVIIDQESFKRFINAISPGAYVSLTKIDFRVLDSLSIKPVGIYGSRERIVDLLSEVGTIEPHLVNALLAGKSDSATPYLRSGIYLLQPPSHSQDPRVFVVYWPEETTWDDDAVTSVKRNRVTFMRYLIKIVDQLYCLISSDHASSLVWEGGGQEEPEVEDDDQVDRLFSFEVTKTNEQEENVVPRPGITVDLSKLFHEPGVLQDLPTISMPLFLSGEKRQAIRTSKHIPPTKNFKEINKQINPVQLNDYLSKYSVHLCQDLDDDAVSLLIKNGLGKRFPTACDTWKSRTSEGRKLTQENIRAKKKEVEEELLKDQPLLEDTLAREMVRRILETYPLLDSKELLSETKDRDTEIATPDPNHLSNILSFFPDLVKELDIALENVVGKVARPSFQLSKERFLITKVFLSKMHDLPEENKREFVALIRDARNLKELRERLKDREQLHRESSSIWSRIKSLSPFSTNQGQNSIVDDTVTQAKHTTDQEFLGVLEGEVLKEPLLEQSAHGLVAEAHAYFQEFMGKGILRLYSQAKNIKERAMFRQVDAEAKSQDLKQRASMRSDWFEEIKQAQAQADQRFQPTVLIRDVEEIKSGWAISTTTFKLVAEVTQYSHALLEYKVHNLSLSSDSRQDLQLNPKHIPTVHIEPRHSYQFSLPTHYTILHLQLLENDKLLLIVDDNHEGILVFLDSQHNMSTAVSRSPRKILHRSKIGKACLFAFDEVRRMLAICETTKLQLHVFVFDEQYNQLQSSASGIELASWYSSGMSITAICFVHGSEELLLIGTDLVARVYSLLTQQFRPASVTLDQSPSSVHSTPDGACLLLSFVVESKLVLKAYHWATFGSSDGIAIECPDTFTEPLLVTSLVNRASIHVLSLNSTTKACCSLALDITKKITDFTFREHGEVGPSKQKLMTTLHNSLIDCHEDVWTRFPVLAAVPRQAILSSHGRCPSQLTFVVDEEHHQHVNPHFQEMKHRFYQKIHKPLSDDLKGMEATAQNFEQFLHSPDWDKSVFCAGEWLVNIICLIPIHLAIARDNMFLPLKDGVSSAEHENSLLGADVSQIVDAISLGWYESVFQSYMAQKPVRVVSSMGEQSVGKSFALNHLVDTSFAGSAMRTTEGVWLSVTPTKDYLVVALDFEGVHSIERSAQEDTLLVLFNTAISNMVLFRNNFALSRDIAGLFQSFQSSSTVLDPAANPTLFQSKLMIIIKDVVDADKRDIVREFSLKFQKIVQDEQDANFITKLHRGKLDIIPWPVIGSKQFYLLFTTIQKKLDQQEVTHKTASEFLQTLKTLMAKLKANDWGALSQNLVAHRALQLLSMLHKAISLGMSDVDEPLKNLDTNSPIDAPDTGMVFYLSRQNDSNAMDKEATLYALCKGWSEFPTRLNVPEGDWILGLSDYLETIMQMRVTYVQKWIHQNLERFKASHASLETLRRASDTTLAELKENVHLCKAQCSSCNLQCLHTRGHDSPHDCQTSHHCPHLCGFSKEHTSGEEINCGFSAGHSGQHMCGIGAHLCGEPCNLKDKKGCLVGCTKLPDHSDDEHMCSARTHACGEPCELKTIPLPSHSGFYNCSGTCCIPSNEAHDQHVCDKRMCPMSCQLCKRLCSNADHLHGLKKGELHLCGLKHPCSGLCKAPGTCEIETTPQSIESTFAGHHETFQYTKYSQVAKRLPCVIQIPEGKLEHPGDHCHSTDPTVFHFCETRCENCGYYCTLPRGHPQREHETNHGSMSRVKWSVEGPEEAAFEVNGHKFATNDDGAPMLCNLYCADLGRHVHIDYCRSVDTTSCSGADIQHISARVQPNPERTKDWVTHGLHWKRMGFKDPYSRVNQVEFAKCDHMCGGPEHQATATNPAQPSHCVLPVFHPPGSTDQATGLGYVSNDGHVFTCRNPVVLRQAFHVIFVIDRSGSMGGRDLRPLPNTPVTPKIRQHNDNRLGAVYSSLHGFWTSRHSTLNAVGQNAGVARRDAYSLILFDHSPATCISNDFSRTPDELLDAVVSWKTGGGTNYTSALTAAQSTMVQHWSNERSPVLIFLSDGECSVSDATVRSVCRAAIDRGKPLSFHTVSFGPHNEPLRRMAQVAREVEATAPRDPLLPPDAHVESSYATALDSVRLAETFLGLANSLRKTRGSLIR